MEKIKQQWSEEETQCFLALWSSSEIEGAVRTKHIFDQIKREMSAAGYDRSVEQLMNKLKKLKMFYREQKRGLGRPKNSSHFDLLDSVLGDRSVNKDTGALNSATATAILESMVEDEPVLQPTIATDPELFNLNGEVELQPLPCSSPAPSCSSSSSSHKTRSGKRKRDSIADVLEYLERSEDRFLAQHRRDQEATTAILQRMDKNETALLGLMGRMVSLLEAKSNK